MENNNSNQEYNGFESKPKVQQVTNISDPDDNSEMIATTNRVSKASTAIPASRPVSQDPSLRRPQSTRMAQGISSATRNDIPAETPARRQSTAQGTRTSRPAARRPVDQTEAQAMRRSDAVRRSDATRRPDAMRRPEAQPQRRSDAQRRMEGDRRPESAARQVRPGERSAVNSRTRAIQAAPQTKRTKKSHFKKGLLTYVVILVVALIVGMILFSSYLGSYEKSRPNMTASSLTTSFSSVDGITKLVKNNASALDVIDDIDTVAATYAASIAGKQISYVTDSKNYSEDAPAYYILADGEKVAHVTLTVNGKIGFGFPKWTIKKLAIASYLPDMTQYDVIVSNDSVVYLNGNPLDSSYITSSGVPKALRNVSSFLTSVPTFDTYTVSSMSTPNITATDGSGSSITLSQSGTTFSGTNTDQAFIDSVSANVIDTLEHYATYFIHESFNLSAYMLPGTDFYVGIFGDENSYGVDTSIYNYEYIDDYGFTEKEATNYVKYSDECFTVDVKYHLYVNFSDDRFSDNDQTLDATWVFVYDSAKADWFLADSQSH